MKVFVLFALSVMQFGNSAPLLVADVGNEWFRGSVVDLDSVNKLTIIDVVIDELSERKQPAVVGFESKDEVVAGHAALALFHRVGKQTIPSFMRLIGGNKADVDACNAEFGSSLGLRTSDEGPVFDNVFPGIATVTANEALGLQLQHARRAAEAHIAASGKPNISIKDIALIFPSSFTANQRKLYEQIAEAAGFTVVLGVSEMLAAAADFASLQSETIDGQKHIFFKVGSVGSSAILAEFTKSKTEIQVKELKHVSSTTVGSALITSRIYDWVMKKIAAAGLKISDKEASKVYGKLQKASNKCKIQLSGRPACDFAVDIGGKNFKTTLMVEEFTALIEDLVPAIVAPLKELVVGSEGVTSVQLVGNGNRALAIKAGLEAAAGSIPVLRFTDGEEGTLMGASTLAANMAAAKSKQTLPANIKDISFTPLAATGKAAGLSAAQVASLKQKLVAHLNAHELRQKMTVALSRLQSAVNEGRAAMDEFSAEEELESLINQGATLASDLESGSGSTTPADLDKVSKELENTVASLTTQARKKEEAAEEKKANKGNTKSAKAAKDRAEREKQRDRDFAIKKGKEEAKKQQKKAAEKEAKKKAEAQKKASKKTKDL